MKSLNSRLSEQEKRKLLCLLAHSSILFSSTVVPVVIPLVLLFVIEDDVVISNAKEVLNFYFSVWIYGVCFGLLIFVVIGFPLLILLGISTWVMPIFAILKIARKRDYVYRYPLAIHLL